MLKSILIGVALIGITVGIHAAGTTFWIRSMKHRTDLLKGKLRPSSVLFILIRAVVFLLLLHIIEVILWALTYVILPGIEEISTLADGVYFSFVTFTTLGYGDITLCHPWRLLSGIEAMNGILLFGWSTAMLFAVVQRVWKQINTSDK